MADPEPAREPTERRAVRVEDPSLSPEANRILTEQLRATIGRDAVDVPRSRPHVERERHGGRPAVVVVLDQNRLAIAMTFLAALVVGAILSLTSGSWWFLLLALGVHAFGTLAMVALVLAMTAETEHLPPAVIARLEDEGVEDPDKLFTQLVAEYAPEQTHEEP